MFQRLRHVWNQRISRARLYEWRKVSHRRYFAKKCEDLAASTRSSNPAWRCKLCYLVVNHKRGCSGVVDVISCRRQPVRKDAFTTALSSLTVIRPQLLTLQHGFCLSPIKSYAMILFTTRRIICQTTSIKANPGRLNHNWV